MYRMKKQNKSSYTTQRIAAALFELMTEKPFMNITVTELAKRAGVGRASFYRNFDTTRDVLDMAVEDMVADLVEIGAPIVFSDDERTWKDFLFRYIYFLNRSKGNILKIRSENFSIILNNFVEKMQEVRYSIPPKSMEEEYNLSAKLAVVNGILLTWKEKGEVESVEEIVNYIMSVIRKF